MLTVAFLRLYFTGIGILSSNAARFHDSADFIGVYADHRFTET